MERVYEPGNGVRERIDELRAARQRLRSDRDSGLYDAPDDADWFRSRYAAMGRELEKLERGALAPNPEHGLCGLCQRSWCAVEGVLEGDR